MIEITLESRVSSVARLHALLREAAVPDVEFQVHRESPSERGTDPAVLVALVGGVSANISALITALLAIRKQTRAKTVVVQGKSGKRLELSGEYSADELEHLVETVNRLDVERIVLDH